MTKFKNRNVRQTKLALVPSVLIGLCTSFGITLVLSALLAVCVINEYLNINTIPAAAFIIWLISAFVGALLTYKIGKGKPVLAAAITSLGYFLLPVFIALLFYDGITSGILGGLIGCTAGCFLAILLGVYMLKPVKKRGRRVRSC